MTLDDSDAPYGDSKHYDSEYFAWQDKHAAIKAAIKIERFKPYVRPTDTVLDFGAAGGDMLAGLPGARKIGVEINDVARSTAESNHGLDMRKTIDDVENGIADVVISNHTLEHIAAPYDALRRLRQKLKPGGTVVIVVPIDDWRPQRKWDPMDINRHLYTWTPMNLGNLLDEAGFEPVEMRIIHRTLMRGFDKFSRLPRPVFVGLQWLYSHVRHRQEQLAVARAKSVS